MAEAPGPSGARSASAAGTSPACVAWDAVVIRSWPGYVPPLVAVGTSLLSCAVLAAVETGAGAALLLPVPLLVSVVWGAALVMARPHRSTLLAAVVWLVAALVLFPATSVWTLAAHVAAGLVAGSALGIRWRLDLAVAGVALALAPLVVWSLIEIPVAEQLALMRAELAPLLAEQVPASAAPKLREKALVREHDRLDQVLTMAGRIYPFVLGVGLLGQGLLVLILVWLVARLGGWRLDSWRPPPFARWRLPFYLVWILAAGVGLLVTRRPGAADFGLNLALLAALLLSVQGTAVQFHATARVLSPLGRVVFWSVMGLFFLPLVLAGGLVLGLADQWLDLRGLERGNDPGDAAPPVDAGDGDGSG